MRRRSKNPIAKHKILKAAEELMLVKGFTATSLDEICQRAKLTKGSFFHYFKNKEELGQAVLESFCCSSRDKMSKACSCQLDQDPFERLDGYLDNFVKMINNDGAKGCLLANFSTELSDVSPAIRSACEEGFRSWGDAFKENLKEVKKKYAPKKNINIDSLAEHFLAVVEGSQVLAKANKDKKLMKRNLEHFKEYLHSIFKK